MTDGLRLAPLRLLDGRGNPRSPSFITYVSHPPSSQLTECPPRSISHSPSFNYEEEEGDKFTGKVRTMFPFKFRCSYAQTIHPPLHEIDK